MKDSTEIYNNLASMEPLLPDLSRNRLSELTCEVLTASGHLSGSVHSRIVKEKVAALTREMNCYYSNLIEGHKTTPRDIERALRQDFSDNAIEQDNQKLSLAHIAVNKLMEDRLASEELDVYAPEFICWLHDEFYRQLPRSMWVSKTQNGKIYNIVPGKPRNFGVDVHNHTPPDCNALPAFLERFHSFYSSDRIFATNRLIAIAAAHHRLAWIHPFGDGNGRVTRLHSHALLIHHGINVDGLWTLSRGLARFRKRYYQCLAEADKQRRNDYDGRGNLSQEGLASFCTFFLETMLDQIKFMDNLLQLGDLRIRVERFFQYETLHLGRDNEDLMKVVRVLVDEGEIHRSRVEEITGKGATVAWRIIQLGLKEGLISSPSTKGVLQIAFPDKVLGAYFPQLYLDLPVDTDQ